MISAHEARKFLHYDAETGVFRWRNDAPLKQRVDRRGNIAGAVSWDGYVKIKLGGKIYSAHRLAWLLVHGAWPSKSIDHIDGNRSNNKLANLRECTPAQNAARRVTLRSKAPARGVTPHGSGFVARIHHGGKRHYLGYHPTLASAVAAYDAAAKSIHGEFAFSENLPPAPASYMGLGFAGMN